MRNTDKRCVRSIVEWRAEDNYQIRGYASTFDRYVLYDDGPYTIYEQVDRHAFDDADLSDVVLRIDHAGKVYCRTSAHTLVVGVDDHGLYFIADLSKTEAARALHEEIRAGNYPQASYCYRWQEKEFDDATHTSRIMKISKVFDVSPVAFPQNDATAIYARSMIDGEIEGRELAERLARDRQMKTLNIKLSLLRMQ